MRLASTESYKAYQEARKKILCEKTILLILKKSEVYWQMSVVPSLRRLGKENDRFKASLSSNTLVSRDGVVI